MKEYNKITNLLVQNKEGIINICFREKGGKIIGNLSYYNNEKFVIKVEDN